MISFSNYQTMQREKHCIFIRYSRPSFFRLKRRFQQECGNGKSMMIFRKAVQYSFDFYKPFMCSAWKKKTQREKAQTSLACLFLWWWVRMDHRPGPAQLFFDEAIDSFFFQSTQLSRAAGIRDTDGQSVSAALVFYGLL